MTINSKNLSPVNSVIEQTLERLKVNDSWFPFPLLFSFSITLIFNTQALTSLNPRLGHAAEVLPFKAEAAEQGAIWLSITVEGPQLRISTGDRKVMTWNLNKESELVSEQLAEFLKDRQREISLSVSLSKQISHTESIVVLAVDQGLKYLYLKPVLLAMAKAGISEYAFETVQPTIAE